MAETMERFLPRVPPLQQLPEVYEKWEDMARELPKLIATRRVREEVKSLPLLPVLDQDLPTERHWERAYAVLTFISQGYLWEGGESDPVSLLPKQLAVPWYEAASRCGLPPVATYASTVLWNWRLKDPEGPVTLENLETLLSFSATRSEEWFYMIPMVIEIAAVPGVRAAKQALLGVEDSNDALIISSLKELPNCLKDMLFYLNKMYDECEPIEFYTRIRPFQAGSKNLSAFSGGLIYEGVSEEPKAFAGASAGQSSALPVFDILLGIEHSGSDKEFLELQRWHMPRSHRQFLLFLSNQPSLREYVIKNKRKSDLLAAYNECIRELTKFRSDHVILVTRFIVNPSVIHRGGSDDKKNNTLASRGTGGSDFMSFLKNVRDNTQNCLIT